MSPHAKNLAVVPAFNEAATVTGVVERLHEVRPDFDVLVIDDGSLDATAALAERAGARVLRHPYNLGIGGAVQSGFLYARQEGFDYLVRDPGAGAAKGLYPLRELGSDIEALRFYESLL